MVRGRDRPTMLYDILIGAQTPILQTNLQTRANLSYNTFKKHIEQLLESALIEDVSDLYSSEKKMGRVWYLTTKRGREWLETYEKLIDIEKGGRSE